MDTPPKLELIYDGDCPVCRNYVRFMRLRESAGEVSLVDARGAPEVVKALNASGLDLDEGMVLRLGEQCFHGDEALLHLALLSTRSGLFNRLNYWLFSSPRRARWSYPWLRAGRNLLLRLLGKSKINH